MAKMRIFKTTNDLKGLKIKITYDNLIHYDLEFNYKLKCVVREFTEWLKLYSLEYFITKLDLIMINNKIYLYHDTFSPYLRELFIINENKISISDDFNTMDNLFIFYLLEYANNKQKVQLVNMNNEVHRDQCIEFDLKTKGDKLLTKLCDSENSYLKGFYNKKKVANKIYIKQMGSANILNTSIN